jgi:hypothetical protein
MWYCVVGQVVPDIAKDHTAFIFRVKHFFLHYWTLTLKAPYSIKMTGTVTSPKHLNLFWNYLFDLATVIYVIIYGPLSNPPDLIWTVYYCKLQFNVSLNWSSFPFLVTCSIEWMFLHIYNSSLEQVSVTPLYIIHTNLRLHTTLSVNDYLKQHTRAANGISRTIVIYQLNFFSYKKRCEIWVKSEITVRVCTS